MNTKTSAPRVEAVEDMVVDGRTNGILENAAAKRQKVRISFTPHTMHWSELRISGAFFLL